MKQLKMTKRHLVITAAIVAILGLAFSVLAETAGGITLHNANSAAAHHSTVSYTPPADPAGSIGLDTMGLGASLAAADFTTNPAPSATATSNLISPSQSLSNVVSTSSTTTTPPSPVPTPTPSSTPCNCPSTVQDDLQTQCQHSCSPNPTPACHPCGFHKFQSDNATACPMYCME